MRAFPGPAGLGGLAGSAVKARTGKLSSADPGVVVDSLSCYPPPSSPSLLGKTDPHLGHPPVRTPVLAAAGSGVAGRAAERLQGRRAGSGFRRRPGEGVDGARSGGARRTPGHWQRGRRAGGGREGARRARKRNLEALAAPQQPWSGRPPPWAGDAAGCRADGGSRGLGAERGPGAGRPESPRGWVRPLQPDWVRMAAWDSDATRMAPWRTRIANIIISQRLGAHGRRGKGLGLRVGKSRDIRSLAT